MSIAGTKGVSYYAYVSGPQFQVNFAGAGNNETLGIVNAIAQGSLQIGSDEFWPDNENFTWNAMMNGNSLLNASVSISPGDGDLENAGAVSNANGYSGYLNNIMETPALVGSNYTISYGLYDANNGYTGLTNQDQSYVYVTDNYSNWMEALVAAYPTAGTVPFNNFVLPGAHDSGMCNFTGIREEITEAINQIPALGNVGFQAVINACFTQKEYITTMLNLGTRYFDFRPGYMYNQNSSGNLYHQHAIIPGYKFSLFMQDVVSLLNDYPKEIVIINLNFQGIQTSTPTSDTLYGIINSTMAKYCPSLVIGNASDLSSSYNDLLQANKRIIFLNQTNPDDPNEAVKYDSYSDAAYETTNVDTIIKQLETMTYAGFISQSPKCDYTVLQLQGTASGGVGLIDEIIREISLSAAASPLMSTKPGFDASTYAWALSNVKSQMDTLNGSTVSNKSLIILLNDFIDNALSSICINITKQRMGLN